MGRLREEALGFEGPMDSVEIDRGFNRTIDILARRAREEREKQRLTKSPPQPKGTQYYIKGHFSEDRMPIPLEDSFRATNLRAAIRVIRRRARECHNVEGYAVSLSLFDRTDYPRKVLYDVDIPAKKE